MFSASFFWPLFIVNNLASFVFGSFWLFFPQPPFSFNNFLASFCKKRILFSFFRVPEQNPPIPTSPATGKAVSKTSTLGPFCQVFSAKGLRNGGPDTTCKLCHETIQSPPPVLRSGGFTPPSRLLNLGQKRAVRTRPLQPRS